MRRNLRGFTLIEVMVVVAVLAVLSALAIPGMGEYLDRHRLIGQMRAITNLVELARSEAIMHSSASASNLKTMAITISPGASWFVGLSNGTTACSLTPTNTCKINQGGSAVSHSISGAECTACSMVSPSSTQVAVYDLRGIVQGGTNQAITLQSPRGKFLSVNINRLGRVSLCVPVGKPAIPGYPSC